jgi:hypothetical protein
VADTVLRYRIELDSSDLNSQLIDIRQRIDQAVQEAFANAQMQQTTSITPIQAPAQIQQPDVTALQTYGAKPPDLPFYSYIPQATDKLISDVNSSAYISWQAAQNMYNDMSNAVNTVQYGASQLIPETSGSFSGSFGFGYQQQMPIFETKYEEENKRAFGKKVNYFVRDAAPTISSIATGTIVSEGLELLGVAASGPVGWATAASLFVADLAVSGIADKYKERDEMQYAFQELGQRTLRLMTPADSRHLADAVAGFINSPQGRLHEYTKDEVTSGILNYAAAGGLSGSKDPAELQRRVEAVMDNLRLVSKTLEIFQDEAARLMGDLEQKGIVSANQAGLFASSMQTRASLVGMSGVELIQAGLQGAQAVVGTGVTARQGFEMMVDAREEMARLALSSNPYSRELMYNLGGPDAAAAQLMQFRLNYSNTGLGILNIATTMSGGSPYSDMTSKLSDISGMFANNPGNYYVLQANQGRFGAAIDQATAAVKSAMELLDIQGLKGEGGKFSKEQLVGAVKLMNNISEGQARILVEHATTLTPEEMEELQRYESEPLNGLETYAAVLSQVESGGRSNIRGDMIIDPKSKHYGTRALGKYQFMPTTLRQLGYTGTEEEFLANESLQDEYFKKYVGLTTEEFNTKAAKAGLSDRIDLNNLDENSMSILNMIHYGGVDSTIKALKGGGTSLQYGTGKAAPSLIGRRDIFLRTYEEMKDKGMLYDTHNAVIAYKGPYSKISDKVLTDFIMRDAENMATPWYDDVWFDIKNVFRNIPVISPLLGFLGRFSYETSKFLGDSAEYGWNDVSDWMTGATRAGKLTVNQTRNRRAITEALKGENADYAIEAKKWFSSLKDDERENIIKELNKKYIKNSSIARERDKLTQEQQDIFNDLAYGTTEDTQRKLLNSVKNINNNLSAKELKNDIVYARELNLYSNMDFNSKSSAVTKDEYYKAEGYINARLFDKNNKYLLPDMTIDRVDKNGKIITSKTLSQALDVVSEKMVGKKWDNLSKAEKMVVANNINSSENIMRTLRGRGIAYEDKGLLEANFLERTGKDVVDLYLDKKVSDILKHDTIYDEKGYFKEDRGNKIYQLREQIKQKYGYTEEEVDKYFGKYFSTLESDLEKYQQGDTSNIETNSAMTLVTNDIANLQKYINDFRNQLQNLAPNSDEAKAIRQKMERYQYRQTQLKEFKNNSEFFDISELVQQTKSNTYANMFEDVAKTAVDKLNITDASIREKIKTQLKSQAGYALANGKDFVYTIDETSQTDALELEGKILQYEEKNGNMTELQKHDLRLRYLRQKLEMANGVIDDQQKTMAAFYNKGSDLVSNTYSGLQVNDQIELQKTANNYLYDIVNLLYTSENGGAFYYPHSIVRSKQQAPKGGNK